MSSLFDRFIRKINDSEKVEKLNDLESRKRRLERYEDCRSLVGFLPASLPEPSEYFVGFNGWPLYIKYPLDSDLMVNIHDLMLDEGWTIRGEVNTQESHVAWKYRHPEVSHDYAFIDISYYARHESSTCKLVPGEEVEVIQKKVTWEVVCKEDA